MQTANGQAYLHSHFEVDASGSACDVWDWFPRSD
jgi:hypothetical protein